MPRARKVVASRSAVSSAIPSPRYYQVYVTLREWVRDGVYAPGSQIPTEAQLCTTFGVSRITVRKAIANLVEEGWLTRRQGKGTFVDSAAIQSSVAVDFSEVLSQVEHLGRVTQARGYRVSQVPPDDETRAALQLSREARVQKAVHIRQMRGQPIGRITTCVPLDVAALLKGRRSAAPMLSQLERHGVAIASADQQIGATLADPQLARELEVPAGSPLLRITRVVYDAAGRAVERVVALYRADAYHYRMRLIRSGSTQPRWESE